MSKEEEEDCCRRVEGNLSDTYTDSVGRVVETDEVEMVRKELDEKEDRSHSRYLPNGDGNQEVTFSNIDTVGDET